MTSKSPVRSCEDVDEAALSYAEVKALATGNPYIKEKMDLDIQVSKLKLMKANHTSQKYRMEDNITQHYPHQIAVFKERIEGFSADMNKYAKNKPEDKEQFFMQVGGKSYTDKKEAGTAIIAMCKEIKGINASADVGEYLGFKLNVTFDSFNNKFVMNVKGAMSHPMEVGTDPLGNITRINNALEAMPAQLEEAQTKLSNVEHQLETATAEVDKPFQQEAELSEKLERKTYYEKQFRKITAKAAEEDYDLLFFDELIYTIRAGLFDEQILLDYLKKEKPEHLEVILTGQQPSDELVELADYVSEIRKIKHPFDQGLPARPGIEK